ncbi:uncharacterized protein [Chelonus insularis]|uniref:uncharacterized protein n=1 Tax=Chelonus insularis TaxID=460826 RepID=UPI00158E3D01|nr:uncharacterized protein LOC118063841 [Chelonus insularis]
MMEETDKNDHSSWSETDSSNQVSSNSAKKRLKSGRDRKDSGKKVRFSDQLDNMSIVSEYEDVNSTSFNTTGGEEFFETCQSFSEVKDLPSPDSNLKPSIDWKNSEDEKNNISNEMKEIKKLVKENNCSSNSSKVVMMVLMEKTGDISVEELSPIINSSLKKLESIVSQSSSNNAQAQQNKENNGLTIVSVDSYTRLSSVECYETSEPINKPQKNQQAVKHSSNNGGIFAAVANVFKNAIKNLSGVATTKNSTNSINSPSTSFLHSPIQHSTPIIQNDLFIQGSRSCKRPREENALVDRFNIENSNSLNIVQSPLQKKARRWYKGIRGRQPIDRMKDYSYPKGISRETQRFQQGALTVKNMILPLPARAFQVDQSTQTDF